MHPVFSELKQVQVRWELSSAEMAALCHVPESRYSAWMEPTTGALGEDAPSQPYGAENAVRLLAIARRLESNYPDPQQQVAWLTKPNSHFDQNRPLDIALSSAENLAWIAYVLETSARNTPAVTH